MPCAKAWKLAFRNLLKIFWPSTCLLSSPRKRMQSWMRMQGMSCEKWSVPRATKDAYPATNETIQRTSETCCNSLQLWFPLCPQWNHVRTKNEILSTRSTVALITGPCQLAGSHLGDRHRFGAEPQERMSLGAFFEPPENGPRNDTWRRLKIRADRLSPLERKFLFLMLYMSRIVRTCATLHSSKVENWSEYHGSLFFQNIQTMTNDYLTKPLWIWDEPLAHELPSDQMKAAVTFPHILFSMWLLLSGNLSC